MKSNWESGIGAFHWEACHDCKHSDPEEGGCNVDNDVWKAKLQPEYDAIYCGAWERRTEDDTANVKHEGQL